SSTARRRANNGRSVAAPLYTGITTDRLVGIKPEVLVVDCWTSLVITLFSWGRFAQRVSWIRRLCLAPPSSFCATSPGSRPRGHTAEALYHQLSRGRGARPGKRRCRTPPERT